ncbi:pyridoxal phosphate-dependent aminotransferase [Nafulsella turpanensis]|uniref:pyridoxal phosphate-dependent aminotransferase n=1 Tax=Nafulsella turpanensis TaxID=1265690 RepID=UPI00034888AF|nr:aminotransferase class I/II-fold pyridoxal phosphate-dependent enzyme [Nafulsella turpanensis]
MINIAERLQDIQEYYFSKKLREIALLKAEGKDIINLGIGSPDMPPPQKAVNALNEAARHQAAHGYQSYKGIPELRKAFCDWYENHYKVSLNPEAEVLPLMGSKEGITYISNAYLNEGDEVLIPNPGYPAYAAATRIAGGVVKLYELKEEHGWLPDLKALQDQDLSRVKIMWINYPHMPSGAKISRAKLKELVDFSGRNGILLCHDNPYSFILNDVPLSIFSGEGIPEHVLELNSLSKSHNMAGWRVGMVAGHRQHIENILIAKSNVDSGMFLGIQKAAIEALKMPHQWYDSLNQTYSARRSVVWKIMEELKCSYSREQAGLFVWGRVGKDVEEVSNLVDVLLYKMGVFVTPGFIFGTNGNRYIRISLCSDLGQLEEALERIKGFNTSK